MARDAFINVVLDFLRHIHNPPVDHMPYLIRKTDTVRPDKGDFQLSRSTVELERGLGGPPAATISSNKLKPYSGRKYMPHHLLSKTCN